MEIFERILEMTSLEELINQPGYLLMILISLLLLFLGIVKKYEPLLIVPIGFGVLIANIHDSNLGVVEGRQPAYMGSFMASLGKINLVRLYLQCSIREQALRFLRREVGEEAYLAGKTQIPEKNYKNLESLNTEIERLDISQSDNLMSEFIENQSRDEDDRHRYSGLYGFDYGNLDGYDIVLNTNNKEPDNVFNEILEKLKEFGFRTN